MTTDTPVIHAVGVCKRFGDVDALRGVSFDVAPGEVVGLLGPNGAGKTTLVRILATLLTPDRGAVSVDGFHAATQPTHVRARIGLGGQMAAVDDLLTGRENLQMIGCLYGLPRHVADVEASRLLARFDLVDAGDRRVGTYSGGMRRRLDVAATLIGRPMVLLLDEPTAGLDPRSRNDLWDLLEDVARAGTTILITSQHLDELDRLATRIVVLGDGRVIADGTPAALKRHVGGHVIDVQLAAAEDMAAVSGAVQAAVSAPAHLHSDRRLTVASAPSTRPLAVLAQTLADREIVPIELSLRLPTLDDVFFALTGDAPTSSDVLRPPPQVPARPVGQLETQAVQRAEPTSRRRVWSDTRSVTRRYCLRMLRTPQLMFFAAVQPILFVVGLTAVFGGLVERTLGGAYIQFLLPGVVVMNLMFAAGSTGLALAEDINTGIIDRLRSLPMTRSAVLAARTLTDLIRNAGAVVVMIAAGYLVGFRPHGNALECLLAIGLCLFFSFAASMGFAALALAVKDPQTVQFATFAPVLPLVFLSSAWLPISTMTPAVRGFAHYQPVNVTIVAVRSLTQGRPSWTTTIQAVLWALTMAAVFTVTATRLYRNTST